MSSDRVGALSGILHAVFVPLGFGIFASATSTLLGLGSTRQEIAAEFAQPAELRIWIGDYIEGVAFLLFLVFAGRLWGTLRRAEGGSGWLSTTAFAAAAAFVATSVVSFAVGAAAYYQAGHGLDPQVATALSYLRSFLFLLDSGVAAVFLAAVAGVVLQTRALPRTLGWAAAALGVVFLAGIAAPKTDLAQLPQFGFLIWILAVSVTMLREQPAEVMEPAGVGAYS